MSKRKQIASAVIAVFAIGGSAVVSADPLVGLQNEAGKTHAASVKSQERIDSIYEQTQDLLIEYRAVVDETENLKVYNDHVARLVADQQEGINDLQRQIDNIDGVRKGVVPLMYKMIDSLEQFIELDVPINYEQRKARVARLRDLMGMANVTTSEQFRQVLDAFSIELDYGGTIAAYQDEIEFNGTTIAVDKFNLGRAALVALSLDQKSAWVWDNQARQWSELGDEFLSSTIKAVKMARKIEPYNLVKMPIAAAE
ncbi:MAG: DUF3450 family protein [Alteromonadaceae bacterium]|nr:DUF3450 family protein [Alteromonadaceae bacterium]